MSLVQANRPSSAGDSHRHGNGNALSPNGSAVGSHGDDKKARRPRLPRLYLYIQMQLCRRESLRDWLQLHVERDRALSLSIFEQIVVAVDYVHSHGLMHRDLKVRLYCSPVSLSIIVFCVCSLSYRDVCCPFF